MSTPHPDNGDGLARVKLGSAIEPSDLCVTGLVSELGAVKVLDYLEAASEGKHLWGFTIGHELARAEPGKDLEQAAQRASRSSCRRYRMTRPARWPAWRRRTAR